MKRMLWLTAPLILAFGACVDEQPTAPGFDAPAVSPSVVIAATGTETQITTDTSQQYGPAISGDKIVYEDYRNGNTDIYLYDLSTSTETQITTNTADQHRPAISGNRIVYEDNRNGNYDIYLYDLSTNTETQLTTSAEVQISPAISGDKVVWQDGRSGSSDNYDIYLYDLTTNTERQITTNSANQYVPAISGDRIVWQDWRNGGQWDIYLYDLSTSTETQITTDPAWQTHPAISGDKIVWEDQRLYASEELAAIYLYDLSTNTETQITKALRLYQPDVSGDRIVWNAGGEEGAGTIYVYEMSTKTATQITTGPSMDPAINGNRIVYTDFRNWDSWDIYLYVVAPATSFTSSCTFTIHPKSGQQLVTVTWANASPGVTKIRVSGGNPEEKQQAPSASSSWSTNVKSGTPTYGIWGGTSRKDASAVLVEAGTACTQQ